MAVVTFKLHGKSGKQLEINQSLIGIADKLKKLDGCKNSKVYQDIEEENIFFLVEEWKTQRQLDDHMKTNLFKALLGMDELLVKKPEIMFMNEG